MVQSFSLNGIECHNLRFKYNAVEFYKKVIYDVINTNKHLKYKYDNNYEFLCMSRFAPLLFLGGANLDIGKSPKT